MTANNHLERAVPLENLPLRHFFPGTTALPIEATSAATEDLGVHEPATAERHSLAQRLAHSARNRGCSSIAFFDPTDTAAVDRIADCAFEARLLEVKTIVFTTSRPLGKRARALGCFDAACIDLQANSDAGLDFARWLKQATGVWVELSAKLHLDSSRHAGHFRVLCAQMIEALGFTTPLHLSCDASLTAPKPAAWLRRARRVAEDLGLEHVYTDNIFDSGGQATVCPSCGSELIGRRVGRIVHWRLDEHARCLHCGTRLVGRFGARPLAKRRW